VFRGGGREGYVWGYVRVYNEGSFELVGWCVDLDCEGLVELFVFVGHDLIYQVMIHSIAAFRGGSIS